MMASRGSESESAVVGMRRLLVSLLVDFEWEGWGGGERREWRWSLELVVSSPCLSRLEERCGERCRCRDSLVRCFLGDGDLDLDHDLDRDRDLDRCLFVLRSGERDRRRLWLRLETLSAPLSEPRS